MTAEPVNAWDRCAAAPDGAGPEHECMIDELRCAYCGERIAPCGCNGCGQFLAAARLNEGSYRCEACE